MGIDGASMATDGGGRSGRAGRAHVALHAAERHAHALVLVLQVGAPVGALAQRARVAHNPDGVPAAGERHLRAVG